VLVTPAGADAAFAAMLRLALRAGDVASVVLRCPADADRRAAEAARALVEATQEAGAAAIVSGDSLLVGRTGADGYHATGADDLAAALADLHPDRIVGAGGLRSRDDAMAAGEAGADYVLFGFPGETRGNALDLLAERAAWWQEIFEPPCVVYAPTLEAVGALAEAGADFVALDAVWEAPEGVAAAVARADAALGAALAGAAP
jgi:thiamine-phosphate pyrophosphorylase